MTVFLLRLSINSDRFIRFFYFQRVNGAIGTCNSNLDFEILKV